MRSCAPKIVMPPTQGNGIKDEKKLRIAGEARGKAKKTEERPFTKQTEETAQSVTTQR